MVKYNYKKPSSINWVTIFIVLLLVSAVYAGWKFIPVWWQAQKVEEALEEVKLEVSNIQGWTPSQQRLAEEKLRAKAIARIHELGIEDQPDQPVQVFFTEGYTHIKVTYEAIVDHVWGKQTRITINRSVKIPTTRGL
jgi:hypothetical protein